MIEKEVEGEVVEKEGDDRIHKWKETSVASCMHKHHLRRAQKTHTGTQSEVNYYRVHSLQTKNTKHATHIAKTLYNSST